MNTGTAVTLREVLTNHPEPEFFTLDRSQEEKRTYFSLEVGGYKHDLSGTRASILLAVCSQQGRDHTHTHLDNRSGHVEGQDTQLTPSREKRMQLLGEKGLSSLLTPTQSPRKHYL